MKPENHLKYAPKNTDLHKPPGLLGGRRFHVSWLFFHQLSANPVINNGATYWYDIRKWDKVTLIVIRVVGLVMIIIPLWTLDLLENLSRKIGFITGFVILFYGALALATTAKVFGSLGATGM